MTAAALVLDCGMHPKFEGEDATPDLRLVPDGELDAIIVTHAHLDHIGSLPVLMRRQPRARVFMSPPTAQLGEALLHNSVNVMARPNGAPTNGHGHPAANPATLLFTHREADQYAQIWQPCALRQRWDFEGDRLGNPDASDASFEFFDAGHILGSTGVLIRAEGKRVFYSGDVIPGPDRQPRGRVPGRRRRRAHRHAHRRDDPRRPSRRLLARRAPRRKRGCCGR